MKTIKFYKTKGFRPGYEYELIETGTGFKVIIRDEVKAFNEAFLKQERHEIYDYAA